MDSVDLVSAGERQLNLLRLSEQAVHVRLVLVLLAESHRVGKPQTIPAGLKIKTGGVGHGLVVLPAVGVGLVEVVIDVEVEETVETTQTELRHAAAALRG